MSGGDLAYLAFGVTLVALLAGAFAYYYSRKRRARVEAAKFTMLHDDD